MFTYLNFRNLIILVSNSFLGRIYSLVQTLFLFFAYLFAFWSREMMNSGQGRESDPFPAGLRVLVVDDDPTCLLILERMLRTCLYRATKCNRAEVALSLLRKNKNGFDIVISDVHMPDMDGFKLLEHIGLEMDLPVIMMSADDSKSVVLKGVTHGAVDYLIKPVRMEALKNIWQHVVRKKKRNVSDDDSSSGSWRSSKKRKEEEVVDGDDDDEEDTSSLKKARVVWSVDLHQQFVAAVNHLGVDKAVPKKILEMMNVPGLTRENVASHLQKYRIYLRRLGGVCQNLNHSFMTTSQDPSFGQLSTLKGFDLQAQSLAQLQAAAGFDQRSIFSFENPKIRFGDGQMQTMNTNKLMSLLHGGHIRVEQQSVQNRGMMMMMPVVPDQLPRGRPTMLLPSLGEQIRSDLSDEMVVRNSSSRVLPATHSVFDNFLSELPRNSFPGATAPGNVSSSEFGNPSYDIFNDFPQQQHHNRTSKLNDWDLREVEYVQNQLQQQQPPLDGGLVKVKSERVAEMVAYNQDDLMNAFLKQESIPLLDNEFDFDGYSIDNIPV